MRRLLLAAAALGFVASIGTAYATPDTSNTVEMWNLASVPGGDQNSGAAVQQALPSAEADILAITGNQHFGSVAYSEPINYSLNLSQQSATISQFFAADSPTAGLPTSCDTACGNLRMTAPNFASVTLFEFTFTTTGEIFTATHDDGVSLFADGNTTTDLLPVSDSAPTSSETTAPITLTAGTYDLYYTAANGTPEDLVTNTVPVPAPLIGHGLLVLLAAGGLLFGAKLFERSNKQRSYTPAGAAA